MPCEIILEVGAEGGTLALFGSKNDVGEWEFWTGTDETAIFDSLEEEDRSGLGNPVSTSKSVASLPEALALLDKHPWFRLIPLEVHPDFRDAILIEVQKRGTQEDVDRWRKQLHCFPSIPTASAPLPKSTRVDGQMTGLAGELFVAAELLKRGVQASITFGNAKQIDLLAYNPETGQRFTIQVKTLRQKGYFPIRTIEPNHVYVFVVLNKPGEDVRFLIVPGKRLLDEPERFDYKDPKFPGLYTKALLEFEGDWGVFGC